MWSIQKYLDYIENNRVRIGNVKRYLEYVIYDTQYHEKGTIAHIPKNDELHAVINDSFSAAYQVDKWVFIDSQRGGHSLYYMSDVVAEQYGIISRRDGFFGVMPTVICRHNISNENTLNCLKKIKNHSKKERLLIFMNETVNGKSTQKILDVFNMEATELKETYDNGIFGVDIYVRKRDE